VASRTLQHNFLRAFSFCVAPRSSLALLLRPHLTLWHRRRVPQTTLKDLPIPDPSNPEDASARFNRTVSETTERLEKEAQEFIKYLNDQVVPTVRVHSTKALRSAAQKLQELANYMEQHSSSTK